MRAIGNHMSDKLPKVSLSDPWNEMEKATDQVSLR